MWPRPAGDVRRPVHLAAAADSRLDAVELAEIADRARAAARRLAGRIGDLGGAITANPRQLLDRQRRLPPATRPCSTRESTERDLLETAFDH
jgi:hypothetical protein